MVGTLVNDQPIQSMQTSTQHDIVSTTTQVPDEIHPSLSQVYVEIDKAVDTFQKLLPRVFSTEGFSSLDPDTIDAHLNPVMKAMEKINVESLLSAEYAKEGGVSLGRGHRNIEPIYDQICPHHSSVRYPARARRNHVRYLHVTEVPGRFSMGIFVFPPGAMIPLHDHPGMSVLSRVLYGDLRVRSYDVIPDGKPPANCPLEEVHMKPAKGKSLSRAKEKKAASGSWLSNFIPAMSSTRDSSSSVSTVDSDEGKVTLPEGTKMGRRNSTKYIYAPQVTSLHPYQGNMHEFTAGERGAAVLDVLLPPYDFDHDRDCTFYHEEATAVECNHMQDSKEHSENYLEYPYVWLIPISQPSDFQCTSGRYLQFGEDD